MGALLIMLPCSKDNRNESDQVRIVLIFEVWHPDLKEEEQAVVEESYILYEQWMKNRDYDAMIDV